METKVSSLVISFRYCFSFHLCQRELHINCTLITAYLIPYSRLTLVTIYALQESLDTKSSKRFPLTLRLIVLVIAVICGIYIWSICLEHKLLHTNTKLLGLSVLKQPCHHPSGVEEWEVPYLHYPEPVTHNR